jgi:creatinine amidohydrolase
LRPELVRTNHIVTPQDKPVNWADPKLDLSRHTNTGVIGDPTYATAELGQELWQATIAAVALILKDAADATL